MADFFDVLNGIISGMTMTNEPVTGLGGVYFILIFLLLFSLTFTATAYVPMFHKKDEYKNIRIIIALSMAFLTTITFFSSIVEYIQFFGLVLALGLGISIGILGVMPKSYREKENVPNIIGIISIIIAVILSLILLDMVNWFDPLLQAIINAWTNLGDSGKFWLIIILTAALIFITAILRETMARRGGPAP